MNTVLVPEREVGLDKDNQIGLLELIQTPMMELDIDLVDRIEDMTMVDMDFVVVFNVSTTITIWGSETIHNSRCAVYYNIAERKVVVERDVDRGPYFMRPGVVLVTGAMNMSTAMSVLELGGNLSRWYGKVISLGNTDRANEFAVAVCDDYDFRYADDVIGHAVEMFKNVDW